MNKCQFSSILQRTFGGQFEVIYRRCFVSYMDFIIGICHYYPLGFPGGSDGRVCLECWRPGFNPWVRKIPWRRKWKPKKMATHSGILAWKIPWTEAPGGLYSMGSQRVRHNWATDFMCLLLPCLEFCFTLWPSLSPDSVL